MPWTETYAMKERIKFVSAYLNEEDSRNMSELCQAFGISRKTGYKALSRYRLGGFEALSDLSRAPHTHPNETNEEIVDLLVAFRLKYPTWGPKKLLLVLSHKHPEIPAGAWPAPSTAGQILKRKGLVEPRKRRRHTPPYTEPFSEAKKPNDLWCADHKGWFRTGDGLRCEPLTITDAASRYIIDIRACSGTTVEEAWPVFRKAFQEYGLPTAIRTDNGTPFASPGLGGLTRLSAWWVRLGIIPERITPGKPQENGRHERMHKDLKNETAKPPSATMKAQQKSMDRFRNTFNNIRPHESLCMKTPDTVFQRSRINYPRKLPEVEYPSHFEVRMIRSNGQIKWKGEKLFVTETIIGQPLGLERISDSCLKLYYGFLPLGFLDEKTNKVVRVSPLEKKCNEDN